MKDIKAALKTVFFTQKGKSTFFDTKDMNFITWACLAAKCNYKDVPMFASWVNIDPKYYTSHEAPTISDPDTRAIYHN